MTTLIPVPLRQRSYNIAIAPGGLSQLGEYLSDPTVQSQPLGHHMLVVSNPEIWDHYGQTVMDSLQDAGFQVDHCLLPAGEQYKNLASIETVYDAALAHHLERSSTLVALGGGVIGDMTGFAAATWLRGIHVVQVPTSLLAMVDAAIGGKTGVNHPKGKNLIGAFHQPRFVLIDPYTLKTLPVREFRAAMAEVIKYGVIWDAELFAQLEAVERLDEHAQLPPELLTDILKRSCQAKAEVVSQDEREGGLRAILNYGHTIGHAIESLTGYSKVNHGEAVGLGMLAAGHIAVAMGWWSDSENERQAQLVRRAGLPDELPSGFPVEQVAQVLLTDKKVKDGKVRFILPRRIGAVEITDQVSAADILRSLQLLSAT